MKATARNKRFRGATAALAAALACCLASLGAAGCGQITCDFDEMWSAAADPGSPQVNPETYESVEMYMTYDEVAAIFGGPGYLTMEHTLGGHTTKHYTWVGRYDFNVSVSFTDGVVTDKSWWVPEEPETGEPDRAPYRRRPRVVERPEPPPAPGVTLANFKRIKNGMPYREVAEAFGGDGKPRGSRWIGRTELKEYEWRNDRGGRATVDFTRGRVCRKHQRGLR